MIASPVTSPCHPSVIDIESTFLPTGQMRQINRVTAVHGPSITGEVDLGLDHWVFAHHFPGDPIFPGTLLIEAAGQLIALWAWHDGQRGRPRLVRAMAEFHYPVTPDTDRLQLRSEIKKKRHLHFALVSIWAGETQVATVEGVLAVLPTA